MGEIFKAYDIRGSYPEELNEAMAERIGAAFIGLLKAKHIVVGRDMRLSSPLLAKAFINGAIKVGASVTDIGMVSTPLLYHAIVRGQFDGGAMVTASHLPRSMNGFKLCREQAIPLSGERGLPALEREVREGSTQTDIISHGSLRQYSMTGEYIKSLTGFVQEATPLTIVVDAGNGMAGPEIPLLFESVSSWTLVPMYLEPDGTFPHHPANPLLSSTTRELQARVPKENAAMGVAFDGDADRCGFIDEQGTRIREDIVTALIAQYLLKKCPGAAILYDLRSSRIVPETISESGGKAIRSRVGHAFIKSRMRKENALFGGELSGHYYYRDMGFTDNAILTLIYMANLISGEERPLSTLVKPFQKYASSGEINLSVRNPDSVFTALQDHFGDARIDHLDGLTVDYPDWWFNIRSSHTEPVMRLNLEAPDTKAVERHTREILSIVGQMDPTMAVQED
jgi:phosphomannomutase